MQSKLWTFAACTLLIGACGDSATSGSKDNDNRGGGSGGRGIIDLGDFDAGSRRDGGGGTGGAGGDAGDEEPLAGSGGTAPTEDAEIVDPDGGDAPAPDGDVPIDEPPPPDVPEDPGTRGPWPAGVRSMRLSLGTGSAPAEIWYPAKLGSDSGQERFVYDYVNWLPPEAQEDIPAADRPVPVLCDCYRDLPIATSHGPFPAVVFAHDLGSAGVAALNIAAHWASRGFIVVALDHPKIHLQDVLAYASVGWCTASGLTEDLERKRDVPAELAMLRAPEGDFAFLEGAVDATRIAVVGHGEGATFAAKAAGQSGVQLIMQWNASLAVTPSGDLKALAFITGSQDGTTGGRPLTVSARATAATLPTLYANATNAGHLSISEVCNATSPSGRDGMQIAARYGLCDIDYTLFSLAWDCSDRYLDQPTANQRFGKITTAALEQFLKGKDRSAAVQQFDADWGDARLTSD